MDDNLNEYPGLSELINNASSSDPIDQLRYDYQDATDLVHQLLTAISKIQRRAYNAAMDHLTFELYAEPPTLYDLAHELINTYPGDEVWRKMRHAEVMAEHKFYIHGDFFTLKEHFEPYIFVVVTHANSQQLNWFDKRWVLRAPWLTAKLKLRV